MPDLGLFASFVGAARIDRAFVQIRMPDGKMLTGNLTQNGYALLAGLIERTGGTSASVIDMTDIANIINDALSVIDTLTSDVASLRSQVESLDDSNEALQRQLEGMPRVPDLSARVETIEGRLQ